MPPRHGKSELLSHWTPVWYLANWPEKRIILASYAADFASTWGRKVRNTVISSGVSISMSDDSVAAARWETTEGGGMVTAGVGGPITGRGADLLVIDDPIKNRAEATSAVYRQHLWDWWTSTARTRLEPSASVIVIMTRWHEDDLVGRLLEGQDDDLGDKWSHIRLPALAEPDDLFREEGMPLWPDRYSMDALVSARMAVGVEDWACLYQQRPAPPEGSLFKLQWWRAYDREPTSLTDVVQFWDTAYKTGQANDYSVCVTLGYDRLGFYVLHVWRDRVDYPALVRVARALYERYQPSRVFVEDAASGQSLVQTLRSDTQLPVVPVRVDADKVSRANAVTGLMEAGKVYLPQTADWLPDFVDELSIFPNGSHDDQVDAFVGALRQAVRYGADFERQARVHQLVGAGQTNGHNPLGLDLDDPKYIDR
jgi:predicted phage terminase large subunit-like protein